MENLMKPRLHKGLTETPKPKAIITENTPFQEPYKSDLTVYGSLIGGDN